MRVYAVRPGDSPAKIAIEHAGCPKCAIDLVRANPHKQAVVYPNGFTTFKSLKPGEQLVLPPKWFSKHFDELPSKYFAALPHPDGVTPSKLGVGAAGVLGDYAILDLASSKVAMMGQLDDRAFTDAVDPNAALIDQSVAEAAHSPNTGASAYAKAVKIGTASARNQNKELRAALDAGDQTRATALRLAVQNDLLTALDVARLSVNALYADDGPTEALYPTNLIAAAQAAVGAMHADNGYCASVAVNGSPVNTAVHSFKVAWNASQSPAVPIGTGNFEQQTADAIAKVLGGSPAACPPRVPSSPQPPPYVPPPYTPPIPPLPPGPVATTTNNEGVSTGAMVGLTILGAGVIGGAIYLASANGWSPKKLLRRWR